MEGSEVLVRQVRKRRSAAAPCAARVIDLLLKEQGAGTRIWIAAGVRTCDAAFKASAQVQTALEQQPYSGHIFIFRGRRGDMVKLLWFDGDGLYLFQKRLERGRFIWPQATCGTASLSRAQLSMLLEGLTGEHLFSPPNG